MNTVCSMKVRVLGGVPEGTYLAKFVAMEPTTNSYGEGVKWRWEIVGGAQAGQYASCTTSPNPSARNSCGRIVSGMLGKSLNTGDEHDLAGLVGKTFLIVVRKGVTGGTYVESVTQAPVA
jgi:hypothetical protein